MRIRSNAAFSLIELMVSMGLASIVALGVMALNNVMNKSTVTNNAYFQADAFRKQVSSLLLNSRTWKNTLLNNAALFACATSSSGNCTTAQSNGPDPLGVVTSYPYPPTLATSNGTGGGAFDVWSTGLTAFYYSTNASNGFDSNGKTCGPTGGPPTTAAPTVPTATGANFNATSSAASSSCPFRLVLYWVPVCATTVGCNATGYSMIHVYGYTLFSPYIDPLHPNNSRQISFNPGNYNVNLILSPTP